MDTALDTGVKNARNVGHFIFGSKSFFELATILSNRRKISGGGNVFLIDEYFQNHPGDLGNLPCETGDRVFYVSTSEEPTTEVINHLVAQVSAQHNSEISAVVGIGGGITLDTAKAVSNLMTNGGRAEDYQGWDLVKFAGTYKIGVPTISGTGSEATRTCVMTNKTTGLKLGMNSEYTVFDQLILDPDLTASVPRNQYFYTGMDAWIHCVESLDGSYRNLVGDAYSTQAINLCYEVFKSDQMMSDANRAKLMVASYLGGCAIAMSYVGVVHPFSAGLSVVLGIHHCLANCITMAAMEMFYPSEHHEFMDMLERQGVDLPAGLCANLSEAQYKALYRATIVHEKPLINALGENFRQILTEEKVRQIFERM